MKTIKFDKIIFNESEKSINFRNKYYNPAYEDKLENGKIIFHDSGLIEVIGDKVVNEYNSIFTDKEYILNEYEDKCIITKKSWFGNKKFKVLKEGWITKKERIPFKILSNNLTIIK